jgi:DnaJ-domain-containing protein 1
MMLKIFSLNKFLRLALPIVLLQFMIVGNTRAAAYDPYEVLGLTNTASSEDVRSAYANLAKELHPDRNRDKSEAERESTTLRFYRVQEAYAEIKGDQTHSQDDLNLQDIKVPSEKASEQQILSALNGVGSFFSASMSEEPVVLDRGIAILKDIAQKNLILTPEIYMAFQDTVAVISGQHLRGWDTATQWLSLADARELAIYSAASHGPSSTYLEALRTFPKPTYMLYGGDSQDWFARYVAEGKIHSYHDFETFFSMIESIFLQDEFAYRAKMASLAGNLKLVLQWVPDLPKATLEAWIKGLFYHHPFASILIFKEALKQNKMTSPDSILDLFKKFRLSAWEESRGHVPSYAEKRATSLIIDAALYDLAWRQKSSFLKLRPTMGQIAAYSQILLSHRPKADVLNTARKNVAARIEMWLPPQSPFANVSVHSGQKVLAGNSCESILKVEKAQP